MEGGGGENDRYMHTVIVRVKYWEGMLASYTNIHEHAAAPESGWKGSPVPQPEGGGGHAPPAHAAPEHRSGWWTGVHFVVGSVTCLSPSYFISRSRYFLLAIRSSLLSTGFCFAIALNNSSACTPAFCTRERDTSTCARGTCEARREEEGRAC